MKLYNSCALFLLGSITSLSGFLCGFNTAMVFEINLYIGNDIHPYGPSQKHVRSHYPKAFFIISILAAAVGCVLSTVISDMFGRKNAIMIGDIFFILGGVIVFVCGHYWVLLIGRFLIGFAIGLVSMAVPLYLAQLAPRGIRGCLVGMNYAFIALGTFLSYIVGHLIMEYWRWICILPVIPALIQMVALFKMPRSPRFVYMNSSVADIKEEIKWLYSTAGQLELESEYESIKAEVLTDEPDISVREKFSFLFREYRRGTLTAILLFILHQWSSFNLAMYYGPQILRQSGFKPKQSSQETEHFVILWAIPFAFLNFSATLITICSVDKCGRRKFLLYTIPFSSSALFVLSIALSMIDFYHSKSNAPHWVCLASLLIYCIFFSPGLGSVTWIIGAQIFPFKVRAIGLGVVTFINFMARFVFIIIYHEATESKPGLTVFLIFVCIFGGSSWIFIYFNLKETKGLFLLEIQKYYSRVQKDQSKSLFDSEIASTQNNDESKDRVEDLPAHPPSLNRDSRWLEQQLHARRTYTITEESYYTDSLLSEK